jgi:LPPG:FO 2-phospho-L-lactate transferase
MRQAALDPTGDDVLARRCVALCGGIGGAKLALGLAQLLGERLTVVVNTGDDFRHLGLYVAPDIDTVLYTLSGLASPERGWGRREETFTFMRALAALGGPDWFTLGDGDLAMHVLRTARLAAGESLTAITAALSDRLAVAPRILPMCDAPVATMLDTDQGLLPFQDYFVRLQCRPVVRAVVYAGAAAAPLTAEIADALAAPELGAVILCPSNPWLSIDPILAVAGMRAALRQCGAPKLAISPIIAGRAVKGPTAKIMDELGIERDGRSIAQHYAGLIDGLIVDDADAGSLPALGVPGLATATLMQSLADRIDLAKTTLAFASRLGTARRAKP